jgi:hypothetical protein
MRLRWANRGSFYYVLIHKNEQTMNINEATLLQIFQESFVIPQATIPGCIRYRVENLLVDNGNTLSMAD